LDAGRVREAEEALLAARHDAHRAAAREAAAADAARQARADADEAAAAARRGREADCRAVGRLMEAAAVAEEERRVTRALVVALREGAGLAAHMAAACAADGEALWRSCATQVRMNRGLRYGKVRRRRRRHAGWAGRRRGW
jgi:hypothetical protein